MSGAKAFYEEYWRRRFATPEDPFIQTRYDLAIAGLRLSPHARVLDCGSGHGALVGQLNTAGYRAEGIEIAEAAVIEAKHRFPESTFHISSLEDMPWPVPAGAFDAAISLEVIEHLLVPRQLLLGMHEAVRPGGRIAVSTPFHGVVKSVAIALRGFDRHYDVEGAHIRFFSDDALKNLIVQAGFRVLALRHYGRFQLVWAGSIVWAERV